MPAQKGSALIIIFVVVTLVLAISGGLGFYYMQSTKTAVSNQQQPDVSQEIASPSSQLKTISNSNQSVALESKIENAIKILKTRDKLWLNDYMFFTFHPDTPEKIVLSFPVKLTASIYIDINSKSYIQRIDTEMIQKTIDNESVIGYVDIDTLYIDSVKKTYFKDSGGNAWVVIDESNPPPALEGNRTDPIGALISDSINIYKKGTLKSVGQQDSPTLNKKLEVYEAEINPQEFKKGVESDFGGNGDFTFDFSTSDSKVRFAFEDSRLREIDLIYSNVQVTDTTTKQTSKFNGRESISILYKDDGAEVKEIKIPEGNMVKVEDYIVPSTPR